MALRNFVLFLFFTCATGCWAQQDPGAFQRCFTDQFTLQLLEEDPEMAARMEAIEMAVQKRKEEKAAKARKKDEPIIFIPVVVHVLYKNSVQNISYNQIESQLNILNEDYRRENLDRFDTPAAFADVAADTRIAFRLAAIDPNGNFTTGVTRTEVTNPNFDPITGYYRTEEGGVAPWNNDCYLNLWITELENDLLGFATPPGTSSNRDGVVMDYRFIGDRGTALAPYNHGRTTTHEIGHWLGLNHVWGANESCNSDDGITDTPNQQSFHQGCPSFPDTSCGNGPNGDMFMNYMDYTDDACMNLFTAGQAERMQLILETSRNSLMNCQYVGTPEPTIISLQLHLFPNPTKGPVQIQVDGSSRKGVVSVFNSLGQLVKGPEPLFNASLLDLTGQPAGTYFVRVDMDGHSVSKAIQVVNQFPSSTF